MRDQSNPISTTGSVALLADIAQSNALVQKPKSCMDKAGEVVKDLRYLSLLHLAAAGFALYIPSNSCWPWPCTDPESDILRKANSLTIGLFSLGLLMRWHEKGTEETTFFTSKALKQIGAATVTYPAVFANFLIIFPMEYIQKLPKEDQPLLNLLNFWGLFAVYSMCKLFNIEQRANRILGTRTDPVDKVCGAAARDEFVFNLIINILITVPNYLSQKGQLVPEWLNDPSHMMPLLLESAFLIVCLEYHRKQKGYCTRTTPTKEIGTAAPSQEGGDETGADPEAATPVEEQPYRTTPSM